MEDRSLYCGICSLGFSLVGQFPLSPHDPSATPIFSLRFPSWKARLFPIPPYLAASLVCQFACGLRSSRHSPGPPASPIAGKLCAAYRFMSLDPTLVKATKWGNSRPLYHPGGRVHRDEVHGQLTSFGKSPSKKFWLNSRPLSAHRT